MYLVVIIRESTTVTLVHTKFQYRSFFRVFGHKTFFLQVGYSRVLLHILRELLMIWPHIHKKRVVFSSSSVKTFQIWMDVIFILPFDVVCICKVSDLTTVFVILEDKNRIHFFYVIIIKVWMEKKIILTSSSGSIVPIIFYITRVLLSGALRQTIVLLLCWKIKTISLTLVFTTR